MAWTPIEFQVTEGTGPDAVTYNLLSFASVESVVPVAYGEDEADRMAWLNASTEIKELELAAATSRINRLVFLGERIAADQPLEWPRRNVVVYGQALPDGELPGAVERATGLLAIRFLTAGTRNRPTPATTSGTRETKRIVAGKVEIEYKTGVEYEADTRIIQDQDVIDILNPYLLEPLVHPTHHDIVGESTDATFFGAGFSASRKSTFNIGDKD